MKPGIGFFDYLRLSFYFKSFLYQHIYKAYANAIVPPYIPEGLRRCYICNNDTFFPIIGKHLFWRDIGAALRRCCQPAQDASVYGFFYFFSQHWVCVFG